MAEPARGEEGGQPLKGQAAPARVGGRSAPAAPAPGAPAAGSAGESREPPPNRSLGPAGPSQAAGRKARNRAGSASRETAARSEQGCPAGEDEGSAAPYPIALPPA